MVVLAHKKLVAFPSYLDKHFSGLNTTTFLIRFVCAYPNPRKPKHYYKLMHATVIHFVSANQLGYADDMLFSPLCQVGGSSTCLYVLKGYSRPASFETIDC